MIGIDKQVHIIHCYEVPVGDSNKKEIINKCVFREPLRKFLYDYNFIFVD